MVTATSARAATTARAIALLLPATGSVVRAETLAVLSMALPAKRAALAWAVTVMLAEAPAGRVGVITGTAWTAGKSAIVSVIWLPVLLSWKPTPDVFAWPTSVRPAGKRSFSTTLGAKLGPALATVTTYVAVWPATRFAGPLT